MKLLGVFLKSRCAELDFGNIALHQAGFRIFQVLRTAQDRDNQIDAVAGCDQTFLDLLLLLLLFQKHLILAGIIFILEIQIIL